MVLLTYPLKFRRNSKLISAHYITQNICFQKKHLLVAVVGQLSSRWLSSVDDPVLRSISLYTFPGIRVKTTPFRAAEKRNFETPNSTQVENFLSRIVWKHSMHSITITNPTSAVCRITRWKNRN